MKIHFIHPFSLEKHYGKEINETFALIPDEDWLCILDWDCMLLSHQQAGIIYQYAQNNPDAGMLVAISNRSGSHGQRGKDGISTNYNSKYHHELASDLIKRMPTVTELDDNISGFLMLVSKKTWNEVKFSDELNILHVDRDYARRLIAAGKKILRMNSVYVWHSYRLWNNGRDKSHLL